MKQQVLILDDDELDRRMLKNAYETNGYAVWEASSGEEGLKTIRAAQPDLIILDLNLGDMTGMDICAVIKNDANLSRIPILVMTGNDEAGQNISCLDQGADDYMTKPFDRRELLSRSNAILRRSSYAGGQKEVLSREGISVDLGRRAVRVGERIVENLTPKEFEIMCLLLKNSPNLVSRELLASKVWLRPLDVLNERTIDVHIRRIRLKLGPAVLNRLLTVAGNGYKFL